MDNETLDAMIRQKMDERALDAQAPPRRLLKNDAKATDQCSAIMIMCWTVAGQKARSRGIVTTFARTQSAPPRRSNLGALPAPLPLALLPDAASNLSQLLSRQSCLEEHRSPAPNRSESTHPKAPCDMACNCAHHMV